MDKTNPPSDAPDDRQPSYPLHRVIGAVDPAVVGAVLGDLTAAGFAADSIDVVMGEAAAQRLHATLDRPGLRGLLNRISLSLGADLEVIQETEQELEAGHSLIVVPVEGDAAKERARDILLAHDGHFIHHFGRWSVERLG